MSERKSPGESLSRRLASRSESGGLHRRAMPDGGEVYSGPLARKALRALGARAFTMDHDIFVDDGFDLSNPEDAALYAHESHHREHSGGSDIHSHNDAEEMAAQAIERMVLHRSRAGEDFDAIMRDARAGKVEAAPAPTSQGGGSEELKGKDAQLIAAYQALLAQGKTHSDIVRELSQHVMRSLNEMRQSTSFRKSRHGTF